MNNKYRNWQYGSQTKYKIWGNLLHQYILIILKLHVQQLRFQTQVHFMEGLESTDSNVLVYWINNSKWEPG
jgi:hypothetical protein